MSNFRSIFKVQLLHMISRLEFKISMTVSLFVVVYAFYSQCKRNTGGDIAGLASAAFSWIGNAADLQLMYIQLFFIFFAFFIGALAFSDSQFVDTKIKIRSIITTRCSRKSYILSGAVVSFCGAFAVIFIPFMISQLLSFLIFPVHSFNDNPFAALQTWDFRSRVGDLVFTSIYYNHPYLYNLFMIFYASVCTGAFAVLSFVLSFFIKRGRVLVVGLPTIAVAIVNTTLPTKYCISYYIYITAMPGKSDVFFVAVPVGIMAICSLIICTKINYLQDELS